MAKLGGFLPTITSKIMQISAFFVHRQTAPTGDIYQYAAYKRR